jgi:integrase
MKITKTPKGTYKFVFHTGRIIPLASDPTKNKPERIDRAGFATKKEAEEAYITLRVKYSKGHVNSTMSIEAFIDIWFPLFRLNNSQGKELRKRTVESYQLILNKHIKPHFGHINVTELEDTDVELFIGKQLKKGLSKETIKKHYRLLSLVADALVKKGYLQTNVVKLVKCPQPPKKTRSELKLMVLDHKEQKTLLDQAEFEWKNSNPDELFRRILFPLIYIGLGTGVRLSEALGLKWSDIVEKGGHQMLLIDRSTERDGTFGPLKSNASYRDIPLSPELYKMLMAHKAYLKELQLASKTWNDNDMIIPYLNGEVWKPTVMSQHLRKLFDRAGVSGAFHTLRHTCITNWLHTVQSMKLVSTLAGHSAISITLDRYGHVLESNTLSQIDNLYATMRIITK